MTRGRGSAGRGHPVARPETSPRPSCPRSPAPTCLRCRAPGEGQGSGRRRALAWSTSCPTGESRPEGGVWSDFLPWRSSALRGPPRTAPPPERPADIASGRIVRRVRCGHRSQGTPRPTGLPERSKACKEARCWARVVFCSVMAVNHGLRRAVGAGSARRVGDVHGRDHAPSPSVNWIRGGAPQAPRPSTTKCDWVRQATNTS